MSGAEKAAIERRSAELFEEYSQGIYRRTDRMFAWLMILQWAAGVFAAVVLSPYTWAGRERSIHAHLYAAIFLGGLISSLPVVLVWLRPGATLNRYVIAVAQ